MVRSGRLKACAVLSAMGLLGGVGPAWADVVWARPDRDRAVMQGELQECLGEARLVHAWANLDRAHVPSTSLGGNLIGMGFAAALTPRARADYVDGCMRGRGYSGIDLTPAEAADLKARTTPEAQAAWIDAFYGAADFARRLGSSSRLPPAPPPTAAPPEPFTYAAARIDPATLKVHAGELGPGAVILSGPISHRATGRIAGAQGFKDFRLDEGLIVQKVVVSGPQGDNQAYWCGRARKAWPDGVSDHCLWTDGRQVLVYPGRDAPWLDQPQFTYDPSREPQASFSVAESQTDLIGPMNFDLSVDKVGPDFVRVVAEANLGKDYIDFWAAKLPFDAAGKAVLPFWSYRLTLTRSGQGVVAALTADGDGKGWETFHDATKR